MKNSFLVLIISIIMLFITCLDDIPEDFDTSEIDWNPNISIALGSISLGMNDESGFNTSLLELDPIDSLPIWFLEDIDIPLNYTMAFDIEELSSFTGEFNRVKLRINAYNGFPVTVIGQVYFQDADSVIIDSVFADTPLILDGGEVNNDGITITPLYEQNDIIFSKNKMDSIQNTKSIKIQGEIQNVAIDTNLVFYFPNYKINIQIGVQMELNYY